jgi:hypothetical protein
VKTPSGVMAIVKQMAKKYRDDVQKATDEAVREVKKLSDYEVFVDGLVWQAIHELIYDERHHSNHQAKMLSGTYHTVPKVLEGTSKAVARASQSLYNLYVAGRTLGSFLGKELESAARAEENVGHGHILNAYLLRSLQPFVPENKTVRESVSERRIRFHISLFRSLISIPREAPGGGQIGCCFVAEHGNGAEMGVERDAASKAANSPL